MVLRVLGIALAAWIVLSILGAVFKFFAGAIVLGAVVFLAAAGYAAYKKQRDGRALR